MSVRTGMYHFEVSRTALYPLRYVLASTSTYHLVLPCTRGTGFQMQHGPGRRLSSTVGHRDGHSHAGGVTAAGNRGILRLWHTRVFKLAEASAGFVTAAASAPNPTRTLSQA
jgi:hypothetical protein